MKKGRIMTQEIEQKLRKIINPHSEYESEIPKDSQLYQYEIDSLNMIEIMVDVEDEFNISVNDDDSQAVFNENTTIEKLVEYIESKV